MSEKRELTNCEKIAAGALIGVARELPRGCLMIELALLLHLLIGIGGIVWLFLLWMDWI